MAIGWEADDGASWMLQSTPVVSAQLGSTVGLVGWRTSTPIVIVPLVKSADAVVMWARGSLVPPEGPGITCVVRGRWAGRVPDEAPLAEAHGTATPSVMPTAAIASAGARPSTPSTPNRQRITRYRRENQGGNVLTGGGRPRRCAPSDAHEWTRDHGAR